MTLGTGYALVINGHSLAFALQEDMEELLFETASKVSLFGSYAVCLHILAISILGRIRPLVIWSVGPPRIKPCYDVKRSILAIIFISYATLEKRSSGSNGQTKLGIRVPMSLLSQFHN